MGRENMQNIAEFNLKSLFKILSKRKIAFFITFIIVLTAGLTFTFLVSPEYNSNSQITLTDNEIFYNDALYEYFPDEANNLWIIPSTDVRMKRVDYITGKLDHINSEIRSDVILNNTLAALKDKITKNQLIKSINISVDRWNGNVVIESYARTADMAYNISKSILDSYINQKKAELGDAYNALLEKLDPEIELTRKEISALEDEIKNGAADPALSKELDTAFEKYNVLNTTKQNMVSNKGIFIDRIKVIEPPELINVKNTSNYLRNISLSLVAAFAIGIISAFTVNYYKSLKN